MWTLIQGKEGAGENQFQPLDTPRLGTQDLRPQFGQCWCSCGRGEISLARARTANVRGSPPNSMTQHGTCQLGGNVFGVRFPNLLRGSPNTQLRKAEQDVSTTSRTQKPSGSRRSAPAPGPGRQSCQGAQRIVESIETSLVPCISIVLAVSVAMLVCDATRVMPLMSCRGGENFHT